MRPHASDLRIRTAARHHKAKRQPSPEMRARVGDTPRKQARKQALGAKETFAPGRMEPL